MDGSERSLKAARGRVLHVEDDAAIARCIGAMLRRCGYEVVSVPTAEAAITLLGRECFDVIVSDFNLADIGTGADVLAACGSTPFVFLTSDDRAGGLGVTRLDKPCSPSVLRDAIRELLEPDKVVREMPLDYTNPIFGG